MRAEAALDLAAVAKPGRHRQRPVAHEGLAAGELGDLAHQGALVHRDGPLVGHHALGQFGRTGIPAPVVTKGPSVHPTGGGRGGRSGGGAWSGWSGAGDHGASMRVGCNRARIGGYGSSEGARPESAGCDQSAWTDLQAGPGQVGHALCQSCDFFFDRAAARCSLFHEAATGPLGHPDDRISEKSAVIVVQPGVDQRLDRGRDGVLHRSEGEPQLLVVSVVTAIEQAELRLPADDQPEIGREAHLDLLARTLAC